MVLGRHRHHRILNLQRQLYCVEPIFNLYSVIPLIRNILRTPERCLMITNVFHFVSVNESTFITIIIYYYYIF